MGSTSNSQAPGGLAVVVTSAGVELRTVDVGLDVGLGEAEVELTDVEVGLAKAGVVVEGDGLAFGEVEVAP